MARLTTDHRYACISSRLWPGIPPHFGRAVLIHAGPNRDCAENLISYRRRTRIIRLNEYVVHYCRTVCNTVFYNIVATVVDGDIAPGWPLLILTGVKALKAGEATPDSVVLTLIYHDHLSACSRCYTVFQKII